MHHRRASRSSNPGMPVEVVDRTISTGEVVKKWNGSGEFSRGICIYCMLYHMI